MSRLEVTWSPAWKITQISRFTAASPLDCHLVNTLQNQIQTTSASACRTSSCLPAPSFPSLLFDFIEYEQAKSL